MRSGHDEESRNGREVKIDILEGDIWTPEWFRVIRVYFRVPESYGNSPREVNGPYWALLERGKKGQGGARLPPAQTELDKGWGRSPPFLLPTPKRKGNPTRTWES